MTRFAAWPPWAARFALVLLALLIGFGSIPHPQRADNFGRPPQWRDWMLYQLEVNRVMQGENYYTVAVAEHRLHRYPTTPPQVFREPTLIWILAALRTDLLRRVVLFGLSLTALYFLWRALEHTTIGQVRRGFATFFAGGAVALAWIPISPYSHEIWSGLLIALSLAIYTREHWRLSILLGLAACFIRELSVLYLGVMALSALQEKNWKELREWTAAIMLFLALFAWHMSIAAGLYAHGDLTFTSAGWFHFGGLPFVVDASKTNFLLVYAPRVVVSLWACLGLLGLAGAQGPLFSRAALVVSGYMITLLFVGLPADAYWGLLYAPLLAMGVALAPDSLRDLVLRALPLGQAQREF